MIYHLTLDGSLTPASLESEGFVHCSTGEQLLATARRYYAGVTGLRVLVLDPQRLTAELRYEMPAGAHSPRELFPHIYGPLNREAIVAEAELPWTGDFAWPELKD